jgi:Uma2 family endonuclease
MASATGKKAQSAGSIPTGPSVETWRAMSPAERLDFQLRVLDALSDPLVTMSEGRPHKRAKSRALDALGLHFKATGRVVYLAEEMAVVDPGEKAFTPDILAVLDVEEPEDDERMSWVVAEERKGLDLVLEVLHQGDRDKDLVENVERYARLAIPEYFVYDRLNQKIHGYRLGASGAARYERIVPQLGRYRSSVLGLDLAILGNNLRFFAGEAVLPGTADLLARLRGRVESLEAKTDQMRAQSEVAARARDVLMVLEVRGIEVPDAERERILSQADAARVERWLKRAVVATSLVDVLEDPR